ncbi:Dyp-type peroxidase [Actinosynnema pretiosum]|uniref:Peroxidase n=1 Tax=Actinosynnema pretiosum TaxID=42197 RepID=A0A290ZBR2_9PSEU|nr:Dyp-type peroxidase [Actinosynnema pretiosum]ATE56403.1 peroxidase [Actinosynnema pretiosum]
MTGLVRLNAARPGESDPPLRVSREVQGNVLAAFNKDHQQLRFLRFGDARLARTWLAGMLGHVSVTADVEDFNEAFSLGRATFGEDPATLRATWVNLSLTAPGVLAVAADPTAAEADLRAVDPLLVEGALARAAANGDTGESGPGGWVFGGAGSAVHAVVTVASDTRERLRATTRQLDLLDRLLGVRRLHVQDGETLPGALAGHEHFGYKDGISQPAVRGFHREDPARPGRRLDHPGAVLVNAGEFVLGHRTEREVEPVVAAWLRDGSIQVVRRLSQDVAGWRAAVEAHARAVAPEVGPERMGSLLVGRRLDGTPLARPTGPVENDFDYADDPLGTTTPCTSHIRKTNPRSFTDPSPRTHRIMRRGIPFGPPHDAEPGAERGLVFVAHCTSLAEQFEFQQRAWANDPSFAGGATGAPTGTDPVIGVEGGGTVEAGGSRGELGFRRFVRTTGAVYALVPSVSALRLLAAGRPLPR